MVSPSWLMVFCRGCCVTWWHRSRLSWGNSPDAGVVRFHLHLHTAHVTAGFSDDHHCFGGHCFGGHRGARCGAFDSDTTGEGEQGSGIILATDWLKGSTNCTLSMSWSKCWFRFVEFAVIYVCLSDLGHVSWLFASCFWFLLLPCQCFRMQTSWLFAYRLGFVTAMAVASLASIRCPMFKRPSWLWILQCRCTIVPFESITISISEIHFRYIGYFQCN